MNNRLPQPLKNTSITKTMAVKCYDAQLPKGDDALIYAIRHMPADNTIIIAIKHNKSSKNAHWHVLVKRPDRNAGFRVSTMLKKLSIFFREGIDDALWENHGVETVGTFTNYAVYLLHKTEAAIQDGKEPYDQTDLVSNLSSEDIGRILEGYSVRPKRSSDTNAYNDLARAAGYELKNFDDFLHSLNILNLQAKTEHSLRECYMIGALNRAKESQRLTRLVIYISMPQNDNMDLYCRAVEKALQPRKTIIFSDAKPLAVEPDTEAVIAYMPYLNYKANEKVIKSLRDSHILEIATAKNKQVWAGDTLIVLHTYDGAYTKDGIFDCKIINDKLEYSSVPQNITKTEVEQLALEYNKFKFEIDKAIGEYRKEYSGVSDQLKDLIK